MSNNNNPININVGILGHVDSGKTSLAKALSRVASTAAFDKNPQSQERGITLDLGFSAFFIDIPSSSEPSTGNKEEDEINTFCQETFTDAVKSSASSSLNEKEKKKLQAQQQQNDVQQETSSSSSSSAFTLQYTLVDCPGHASLIRAVMGASHIIDLMILVIDITKGIQTQTAECLVLGEMLGRKLVVVLNKVDLIPGDTEEEKRTLIEKKKKALRNVFSRTRWPNAPFVEISANPGGGSSAGGAAAGSSASNSSSSQPAAASTPIGITDLKNTLKLCAARMARSDSLMSLNKKKLDPTQFFMMVDHCFGVKGHGTVLTGTVVGGTVGVGDDVKIPDLGLSRRVKSIQVFRKPVQVAHCGDRIGLCVTQVNAERLERGIACSAAPNSPVLTIHHACVCSISKVRFFKGEIESSNMIFHITIGHVTAMATMRFFSLSKKRKKIQQEEATNANNKIAAGGSKAQATGASTTSSKQPAAAAAASNATAKQSSSSIFDFSLEYEYEDKITEAAVQEFALPDDEEKGIKNPEDAVGFVESDRDYFAVVLLDRPVTAVIGSKIIASHLDSSEKTTCRLAMHGQLLSGEIAENLPSSLGTFEKDDKEAWRALRVVKYRERQVNIDKVVDNRTCVARPPKQHLKAQKEKEKEKKVGNNAQSHKANNMGAKDAKKEASPAEQQPAQPQQPVSTKVIFHQPVIELSKFIGFPVVFRKKNSSKNKKKDEKDGDKKNDKKNKNENDDDDDDENDEDNQDDKKKKKNKEKEEADDDDKKKKEDKNNNNENDDDQQQQHLMSVAPKPKRPRFIDIRGKIDSVVGGATNKVKVVFEEDAFDGPRAFGNVLMLDKKFPFSTAFKVEADS